MASPTSFPDALIAAIAAELVRRAADGVNVVQALRHMGVTSTTAFTALTAHTPSPVSTVSMATQTDDDDAHSVSSSASRISSASATGVKRQRALPEPLPHRTKASVTASSKVVHKPAAPWTPEEVASLLEMATSLEGTKDLTSTQVARAWIAVHGGRSVDAVSKKLRCLRRADRGRVVARSLAPEEDSGDERSENERSGGEQSENEQSEDEGVESESESEAAVKSVADMEQVLQALAGMKR